jgi:BirA family transcriptional regulator, biotin operon repressor / biotin---[acetyl-CoA-carboxylase] ligase
MTPPTETWSFNTSRIGRRVLVYDQLESTNTTAAELASDSDSDGLVVIAKHQTSGRGQYGRLWQSRPGHSLLMSALLIPPPELRRPVILTALAAMAVAEGIFDLTGIQARIKWPNDLLLNGKKGCGILIEQHGSHAVIGIGLNLNQSADDFAWAKLPDATSLSIVSGMQFELRSVAGVVLNHLDRRYGSLAKGDRLEMEANWNWRMGLLGQDVEVEFMDGSTMNGHVLEMDFNRLELASEDGTVHAIVPESIRHVVRK